MYQYRTESTVPRPESFCADVITAIKSKEANKAKLWQNLASAAESGMDFSCKLGEREIYSVLSEMF